MRHQRLISIALIFILGVGILSGCGKQNTYDPLEGVAVKSVTDDTGRNVTVPETIERIAPSGATAQMILLTLAPDLMAGLSSSPSIDQMKYFPDEVTYLPTFGQFYGSKASLNMEALIAEQPQVVIDLGDKKLNHKADMASIQNQTGIPTIFFEATLERMPEAYRKLGTLLGREEEAEKLAQFVERTTEMAAENSAKIPDNERKTVLFGTGATGQAVNAQGSTQAQVIDLIGADNAIIPETITNKGGGTVVDMEEIYTSDPDVIILTTGGPYSELKNGSWSELTAVIKDRYYEIPGQPYCWMASPPSVNMVLGVWWLGQLVYPEYYDNYDMVEVAKEYYRLFLHYDLTDEEAHELLANSYFK